MNVKGSLTLLLLIIFTDISAQKTEFSILGKWQRIAYNGNDGANDYTQKVVNGEKLFFEKDNIVKDSLGIIGKYKFEQNKLEIFLNEKGSYYLVYYDINDLDKMHLNPVTSDYQIICDEGCSYTYVRLKD